MTISREQAVAILKEHGLTPEKLTAYRPSEKRMVEGSSFNDEFGIKSQYEVEKVYAWLGY